MSVNRDIIDLIPLLVQGKLREAEKNIVLEQIQKSPELQTEYDFWQGIHAIRRELPRYDFSAHILPEVLDRFVQNKINQLSNEYSEITAHLQKCSSCSDDVELLRHTVKLIPEEQMKATSNGQDAWLHSIFGLRLPTVRALAPVFSFLVVVLALFVIFQRTGEQGDIATILLKPQFEKRSVTDVTHVPEMQVFLKQNTGKVIFAFPTDRIDSQEYQYAISLTPKAGAPVELSSVNIQCQKTQLTNQCELTVTDGDILKQLKQGGSFALSIKEQFPAGVQLVPKNYEYYFKVLVK
jgi:hypothetical protein